MSKNFRKIKPKILIKAPDIVRNISDVIDIYPGNKLIFTNRNSVDIILSLIKKNWFDTNKIKNSTFPLLKKNNQFYPIWLPKKYYTK